MLGGDHEAGICLSLKIAISMRQITKHVGTAAGGQVPQRAEPCKVRRPSEGVVERG